MGFRAGAVSPAGSGRARSDSASLDAQIAELRKKRNDLIAEKKRLKASGGGAEKIAAIERKIKLIEERIKRLEERKAEEQRQRAEYYEERPAERPAETERLLDVRV